MKQTDYTAEDFKIGARFLLKNEQNQGKPQKNPYKVIGIEKDSHPFFSWLLNVEQNCGGFKVRSSITPLKLESHKPIFLEEKV